MKQVIYHLSWGILQRYKTLNSAAIMRRLVEQIQVCLWD